MDQGHSIEVVRGRLGEGDEADVLAFWAERANLSGDAARERLPQVVCVIRDAAGALAGVNSAYDQEVALIGGRRFWIYRSLLAPGVGDGGDDAWERMLIACFDELASGFEPEGPIGLFAPVEVPGLSERMPEAIWPRSGFMYAGFLPDGRQARVRYFPEGRV